MGDLLRLLIPDIDHKGRKRDPHVSFYMEGRGDDRAYVLQAHGFYIHISGRIEKDGTPSYTCTMRTNPDQGWNMELHDEDEQHLRLRVHSTHEYWKEVAARDRKAAEERKLQRAIDGPPVKTKKAPKPLVVADGDDNK